MGLVLIENYRTVIGVGALTGGGGGGGSSTWDTTTVTSSSYTAGSSNERVILADCTSNNITVNLPVAVSSSGEFYHIKKIDSTTNVVNIDGNGSETIDGEAIIQVATQWTSITVVCDGSNWFIV